MANIEKSDFCVFNEELKILSRDNIDEEIVMSTKTIKTQEKGIFKKQNEIKKSYVSGKGEYISLREFCYRIEMYTNYIYSATKAFRKDLQNSICKRGEKIRYFSISYYKRYENDYLSLRFKKANCIIPAIWLEGSDDFEIKCDKIPKFSIGSEKLYNIIKDDVYNFLAYVYSYQNYKNAILREIYISDRITLEIKDFDALNNKGTMVTIRFGELAIFEIFINNNEFKISSFSKDANINLYLKNNADKLLEEIFINSSDKNISKILDVFGGCNYF